MKSLAEYLMLAYRTFAIFLALSLGGCSAKPAAPKDPCFSEYKECLKQFVSEKMYCVAGGETEVRCQELYEVGLKECRATHDQCAASMTAKK